MFLKCFFFFHVIHLQAPKKAKRRQQGEGGSSNVFSMFEQSQIQEYKEVSLHSSINLQEIVRLPQIAAENS